MKLTLKTEVLRTTKNRRNSRQRIRKFLLLFLVLMFPFSMNYYSFLLPIRGLTEKVICGAFLVWLCFFFSSFIIGRSFCGYFCPLGGLQEMVNDALQGKFKKIACLQYVRYLLFMLWMSAIAIALVKNGKPEILDIFYMTENIVSWDSIHGNFIYGGVFGVTLLIVLLLGNRSFCHYFCWYSPLNIIGSYVSRKLKLPVLQIKKDDESCCLECGGCSKTCPMSLPVRDMVKNNNLQRIDCILCGNCVDGCSQKVLKYSWGCD